MSFIEPEAKNEAFKQDRIPYTVYLTQEQIDYLPPSDESPMPDIDRYRHFTEACRAYDEGFPIPEKDNGNRFNLWHKSDEYGQIRKFRIVASGSRDQEWRNQGWSWVGIYDSRPEAKEAWIEYQHKKTREWERDIKAAMSDDEMEDRLSGLSNTNI